MLYDLHDLMSTVAPDVRSKVESKVGKALEKLGQFATSCHVTLKVIKNPDGEHHKSMKPDSHISEVSVFMKGGSVVKVSESAENMETAVDLVAHTLTESLKRYKEKKTDKYEGGPGVGAFTGGEDE